MPFNGPTSRANLLIFVTKLFEKLPLIFIIFSRELYFLRKWSSFCLSMDLVENKASLFLNGQSQNHRMQVQQKYDSWMEKVPELHNGYFYEISRFTWDQSFTYGKWVDINVWDGVMADDQLADYSNCREAVARRGNVVNRDTVWNITGLIIKQVSRSCGLN